jgi:hypothetical protein
VEGLVDWVKEYVNRKAILLPHPASIAEIAELDEEDGNVTSTTAAHKEEEQKEEEEEKEQEQEGHGQQSESDALEMFVGMYRTALEMIFDEERKEAA